MNTGERPMRSHMGVNLRFGYLYIYLNDVSLCHGDVVCRLHSLLAMADVVFHAFSYWFGQKLLHRIRPIFSVKIIFRKMLT